MAANQVILLFLSLFFFNTFSKAYNEEPLISDEQSSPLFITRPNLGVLFSPHSLLDNSNTYWYHVFKIDLLKSPSEPPPIHNTCTQDSSNYKVQMTLDICTLYDLLFDTYRQQSKYLQADIETNIKTSKTLLQAHKHTLVNRKRRGLIDIVGEGMKFLFGTATYQDINKFVTLASTLDDKFSDVETKHNNLVTDFTSFVDVQNRLHKRLLDKIDLNYNRTEILSKTLNDLTSYVELIKQGNQQELRNYFDNYNKYLVTYTTLIDQRLAPLHYIQIQTIEFLQSVQLLLSGKISPRLISQLQVKKLYRNVKKQLQKNYPNFVITNADINNFYDTPNYLFYTIERHLYIQVKIPLSSYNAIYEVYKIISIPLPLNDNQSAHMYTTYKLPPLVAISVDKTYYIDLTQDQYELCKGDPIRHCSMNIPIQTIQQPSCAVAIFLNQMDKIAKLCDSTLSLHKILPQQIYSLGDNTYFITGTQDVDPWTLNCDTPHLPSLPSCTLCTIHLPCSCSLHSKNFIIAKSLHSCNKDSISSNTPSTQFQLNFNFLSNWLYNNSVLDKIVVHSYLNDTPNIQLPSILSVLPTLLAHTILEDREIKLDMKRVVNSLQHDYSEQNQGLKSIFPHIYESDSSTFSSSIPNNIINYIFHALTILLLIIIFFLFVKIRNLTALIGIVSHQTVKTNAFVLTPNLPNKQVSISYLEFPTGAYYTGCLVLTIIAITLMCLLINYLRRYKEFLCKPMKYFFNKNSNLRTDILLECSTQSKIVIIHLISIPVHHSKIVIENPELTIYNLISNCCNAYLRMNWEHTRISVLGKYANITLPDFLKVPYTCINLTKNIINDPQIHLELLIGCYGYYQTAIIVKNYHTNRPIRPVSHAIEPSPQSIEGEQ